MTSVGGPMSEDVGRKAGDVSIIVKWVISI